MDLSASMDDTLPQSCALGPAIAHAAPSIEATRRIPPDALEGLHAAQLFCLSLLREVIDLAIRKTPRSQARGGHYTAVG